MAGSYGPPLPPEIYREILARLPVKSILRCKSVCKSCYSLISCPDFISHHYITNLHNKRGDCIVLHLHDLKAGSALSSFISHDMDIEHNDNDDYSPGRLIGQEFAIVGSCNGLICLSQYEYDDMQDVLSVTFLIWNPSIRKIVELPPLYYGPRIPFYVGFGFDSNTSDFKVMCNLREALAFDEELQKNVCLIFYLSKGVWRTISPLVPARIVRCREAECYVNGALHWSVSRYVKGIGRVVLSFNMNNESFREIRMPDCAELADDDLTETRCLTFGRLVHVIVWKNTRHGGSVDVSESCSVWAMKVYGVTESWIKMSNIDLRSAQVFPSTDLRPRNFMLWAKREILLVHHYIVEDDVKEFRRDLVLFNIRNRKSKHILSVTKCIEDLCLYKESLILM